eukprot:scaffold40680_cov60-Phaeocystis_antarctica.AAC.4
MLGTEATAAHVGHSARVGHVAPRRLARIERFLPSLAEAAEAVRILVPRAAAARLLARLPDSRLPRGLLVVRVRFVLVAVRSRAATRARLPPRAATR